MVKKSKMFRRGEDYTNFVQRMYPKTENGGVACRNITFQITDDCNMRCSYCYEHHKQRLHIGNDFFFHIAFHPYHINPPEQFPEQVP